MQLFLWWRSSRVATRCIRYVVVLLLLLATTTTVRLTSAQPQPPPTTTTTKYLLIGVSGGLQDGFPERSKMDYVVQPYDEEDTTITVTPAIYVGKALIRGYKAFLDVMEPGYRQYVVRVFIYIFILPSTCFFFINIHYKI